MIKLKILLNTIKGEYKKLYYRFRSPKVTYGLNRDENRKHQIIVSLTSYGRRVHTTTYLTLISLLKQDCKPDRIILWLDHDNWNKDNLPKRIKSLEDKGIEVRFCEDLKSYKKLIPTLKLYPNDFIITVDDDQYYPHDFTEGLVKAIENDPRNIYAYTVHKITFNDDKNLNPYMKWELSSQEYKNGLFFPTGVGGIIYNPNNLFKDIVDNKLFMELAPKADDVWFFFMALLNKVKCVPLEAKHEPLPLDNIYQKIHSGSSLRDSNWGENLNDKQIRSVMNHYNISDKDLYHLASH